MNAIKSYFLVLGGGVIGINLAPENLKRFSDCSG